MTSALDILTCIQGMTPNLPCSHPFVAAWSSGAFVLGQTDGQVIEVIKSPGFGQWVVYLLVFLIVIDRVKGWVTPAKREVSGELITSPKTEVATKSEVTALRDELDSFIEQNRAEHQAAITAGQQRVVNLSEVMDKETSELESALTSLRISLGDKIDAAFKELHAHMEPLIRHSASASALIDQIEKRLTRLEVAHTDEVKNLHKRLDDTIRLSSKSKA